MWLRFWFVILVSALIGHVAAAGATSPIPWQPVGLSGGGAMYCPAISPANSNLMALNCDMSGAYLSQDGGSNWCMINQAQLRSDTGCRPAFHPANAGVIYASSGGQLRVSRDGGQTFSRIGNLSESLQGEIAIDPSDPDLMLAGTSSGRCWLSRDAGVTWTACSGPQGRVIGFHFDQTHPGLGMFAGTVSGVWRSDDGGKTWAAKNLGLPWTQLQGFAGGSSRAGSNVVMLYCSVLSKVTNNVFAGGMCRSVDRGDSWQWAMGQGLNVETHAADQYAYGPVSQYHEVLTTDAKPLTVYVMNTSTGFYPPHSDTVYRSDDGGQTWRTVYFEDPRFIGYNVAPDYVSASTGQSLKGGEAPYGAAICNTDPNRVILVRTECQVTHNGGQFWLNGTYPAPGQKPGLGSAWACNGLVVTTTWHYYIHPQAANRHYIAYTDLGFAHSLDGGQSWIWWDTGSWAPWGNTCYELAFDPDTPAKLWGAFSDVHDIPNDNIINEWQGHQGPGGVCISTNYGVSWKAVAQGLPLKPVTSIVLDPASPKLARTLYAGLFEAGVFKSTNDGLTWKAVTNGLGDPSNMRVSRVFLHPDGTLFAMICGRRAAQGSPLLPAGVGLYRSRDGAATWQKVNATRLFLYPKDFSVHPQDSRRILIGACDAGWPDSSGGLYSTSDGGATWQRIGRQGPETFGGYFHPKYEGWIYMTLTEGAPGAGLWLTRDDGRTWCPFPDLPFANVQRVEFDPADGARIRVVTFGGSVWRGPSAPYNFPVRLESFGLSPSGQVRFDVAGGAGRAYVVQTSSDLRNWTPILTNPSPFTVNDTLSPDAARFYRAVGGP